MANMKWSNLNGNQRVLVVVILFTLLTGVAAGGYALSKRNNEVICLSCLALNPVSSHEWWTVYPEGSPSAGESVSHPSIVRESLNNYDAVLLYFWQHGCYSCDVQWENMKADGLVSGTEDNGRMEWKSSQVELHSLDTGTSVGWSAFSVYAEHAPRGNWATPMTVVVGEHEGEIYWFASIGMLELEDLRDGLQDALQNAFV